jgi:hypothetical protein
MDNKFISHDALRKRKARENETYSQRETRLAKQRKNTWQKRARENANTEERKARAARDKERKRVKLVTETDKQREKRLSYHRERRQYLKNVQNTTTQDLNSQQNPQQKSQNSGADGAEDGAEDGIDIHTDAGVLGKFERDLLKKFCNKVNKFKHSLCKTCNESFLLIVIIEGEC